MVDDDLESAKTASYVPVAPDLDLPETKTEARTTVEVPQEPDVEVPTEAPDIDDRVTTVRVDALRRDPIDDETTVVRAAPTAPRVVPPEVEPEIQADEPPTRSEPAVPEPEPEPVRVRARDRSRTEVAPEVPPPSARTPAPARSGARFLAPILGLCAVGLLAGGVYMYRSIETEPTVAAASAHTKPSIHARDHTPASKEAPKIEPAPAPEE